MNLDKEDKKGIADIVGTVIDEKVTPRLNKIETKQKEHDGKLEKIITRLDATFDAVGDSKVDITMIQEDVNDMKYTNERIETRINSVISSQDDILVKSSQLNRRVLKLETKKT